MKLGFHISKSKTPELTRQFARSAGYGVFQTFGSMPKSRKVDLNQIPYTDSKDILWVVHANYPVHFISNPEHRESDVQYLAEKMVWCNRVGADYLVVHLGATKNFTRQQVVDLGRSQYKEATLLLRAYEETGVKLLIENVAAKYEANETPDAILSIIEDNPGLGWCLDFAHANAAGMVDLDIKRVLTDSRAYPTVIHANYPGSTYGSGLDRHGLFYQNTDMISPLLREQWKQNIQLATLAEIPLILEGSSSSGPNDHIQEFEAVKALMLEIKS